MKIRLKDASVRVGGLVPELSLGLLIVASHWPEDFDIFITSANDAHHSHTSLHYAGAALDRRSRHLPADGMKLELRAEVNQALGPAFDFLLADLGGPNAHFHLEYQPKRR